MGHFTVVMNDGMKREYPDIFITINIDYVFINSFWFLKTPEMVSSVRGATGIRQAVRERYTRLDHRVDLTI
jgi:hypothetical protein